MSARRSRRKPEVFGEWCGAEGGLSKTDSPWIDGLVQYDGGDISTWPEDVGCWNIQVVDGVAYTYCNVDYERIQSANDIREAVGTLRRRR